MGLQENLAMFLGLLMMETVTNDGNEFENHHNEIYSSQLILKNEITSHGETTFLDLHLCINFKFKHPYMIKGTPIISTL